MFFHCYHTKLKQWGLAILNGHSDMGACSVGLQNRNIVPEVQENFLCLWEHCEVRRQPNIFFLSTVDDKLHVARQIRSSTQLISMFVFRCLWIIQSGSTDMWRCMPTVSRLMKRMFCSVAGKVRNDSIFLYYYYVVNYYFIMYSKNTSPKNKKFSHHLLTLNLLFCCKLRYFEECL